MAVGHVDLLAKHLAGIIQLGYPFLGPRRPVEAVVVAEDPGIVFLHFTVAAWLEVRPHLAIESTPVSNGTAEGTPVDVVERLVWPVRPLVFVVVDVEAAVAGHPFRLNGAQINAKYRRTRVLVSNIHSPNTGAAAEIQDPVLAAGIRLVWNIQGRRVQASMEQEKPNVVLEIKALLFVLVVGQDILPRAIGMVPTTVLIDIVCDGRGDGSGAG